MLAILVFNAVMILLAAGIATRILPTRLYAGLLEALHVTVGITTPRPERLWLIALLWIAIITLLTDGLVFVFFFLLHQLK
jgi:hypothetical protein